VVREQIDQLRDERATWAPVAAARGDSYGRFDHELDIWYTLGIAYESTRIARKGLSEQPL